MYCLLIDRCNACCCYQLQLVWLLASQGPIATLLFMGALLPMVLLLNSPQLASLFGLGPDEALLDGYGCS